MRVATICVWIVVSLALVGLMGWVSGQRVLASARVDFIPMAPLTSLAFLLTSSALLLHVRTPANRGDDVYSKSAAILVFALCAWKVLEFTTAFPIGIEDLLVRAPAMFGVVPIGRISPITVAGLTLVSTAIILLASASPRRQSQSPLVACFAMTIILGGGVVLVGYLYHTPLLYGGTTIPVALPTAIGFLAMGSGLLAAAGPDSFAVRPFLGTSAHARLLRAFLPLSVGGVLAEGFLQDALPRHLHMNEALISSMTALVSVAVASAIVSRTARSIGGALDRAEAERQRAEHGLRESQRQIKCQFERLTALRAMDSVILSSVGLSSALHVVVDQVLSHLGAQASSILLLDAHTQTLKYAAGKGFRTPAVMQADLKLEESDAGRMTPDGGLLRIEDLRTTLWESQRENLMSDEGFVGYTAAPLIAKGQIRGVLEVFHREPPAGPADWTEFLEALAGQAAIAIDNLSLFDDLQRASTELIDSYDATLDGWARALDLRDNETEGHARRVTEMTVRLAQAMGLDADALSHIRRGALLHDIGKIGIPDSILLKPGPLTEEERQIMQKHPTYAYHWLAPIPFLHAALDIPHYHHEKWDGSGYPEGLQSEQIPLAARIFAIADVWDALRSDRPYRLAWPEGRVLDHIRSLSGSHFDPRVVDVFLQVISEEAMDQHGLIVREAA